MDGPLIGFYGDDFTGSTDAMDALAASGVRTVLFTDSPDKEIIKEEFPDVEAIGIAGMSRSMSPEKMDTHLPPVFNDLNELAPSIVHYKVCSTFDSSPHVGSIGHAVDIACDIFETPFVPVIVGVPELGRYLAFGNLFANVEDTTYRLDRHPVMSTHPVTPMDESDLRKHLSKQTDKSIGLVNLASVADSLETIAASADSQQKNNDVIFFDTVTETHLSRIGEYLWTLSETVSDEMPLFVVGSSGVEYALTDYWKRTSRITDSNDFQKVSQVDELLVMSGSASPITRTQIDRALENGYTGIRLYTEDLIEPEEKAEEIARVSEEAVARITDGDSVIVYSALGPDDSAIEATKQKARDAELETGLEKRIADAQAEILRTVLIETGLSRICIAGGDTCSVITPQLDIYALEVRSPIAPGSPLCQTSATTEPFDNLEIALKGGQLGQMDYFERVQEGK